MPTTSYDSLETVSQMIDRLENHLKAKKVDLANRKLYEPTRLKLAKVAERLEACANLAYELSKSSHVVDVAANYKAKQDYIERQKKGAINQVRQLTNTQTAVPEISEGEKYVDTYISSLIERTSQSVESAITPRQILSEYWKRLKPLADISQSDCYLSEARECATLLSAWFQIRFVRSADSNFFYNANNISKWVDKFLYSYGYHWKYYIVGKFRLDLEDWLAKVRTEGNPYPLPQFIFDVEDDGEDIYCPEVVYLERVIKTVMYDDRFFPECIHTIENRVVDYVPQVEGLATEDLKPFCVKALD